MPRRECRVGRKSPLSFKFRRKSRPDRSSFRRVIFLCRLIRGSTMPAHVSASLKPRPGSQAHGKRTMELPEGTAAATIDATSQPFVGRWHRLVSTPNWEKGRIICQWRASLVADHRPASDYSDETWAGIVVGVTGQHVGRLRRVYERFGEVYSTYDGLYWSHFQAALDWDDAEMWLEGALANDWSVGEMRTRRAETLGAVAADAELASVIAVDEDEDFVPPDEPHRIEGVPMAVAAAGEVDADDEPADGEIEASENWSSSDDNPDRSEPSAPPFAELPDLPDDLAEAVESFKLAIIRHRLDGWRETSPRCVLSALDALRALTLATAE
jgi:hypothetical protein